MCMWSWSHLGGFQCECLLIVLLGFLLCQSLISNFFCANGIVCFSEQQCVPLDETIKICLDKLYSLPEPPLYCFRDTVRVCYQKSHFWADRWCSHGFTSRPGVSYIFINLVPSAFRLPTQKEDERPWERGCLFMCYFNLIKSWSWPVKVVLQFGSDISTRYSLNFVVIPWQAPLRH